MPLRSQQQGLPAPLTPQQQNNSQLSPLNPRYAPSEQSPSSRGHDSASSSNHGTTAGVVTGQIGSGFGPYSYNPNPTGKYGEPKVAQSASGHSSNSEHNHSSQQHTSDKYGYGNSAKQGLLWTAKDAEMDDQLHDPNDVRNDRSWTIYSRRGWLNMTALLLLTLGLIALFGGFPIISYYTRHHQTTLGAWNLGGVNATGQVPMIPNLPSLIDAHTPQAARTRKGFDGNNYNLVFSDEFEVDGRTFWPGDDPFWEAVDLHYWPTGDYEWYDPDAVTTAGGYLQITMTQQSIHDLAFRSGMIQSWNKFCFTGGYIEVSISLPGSSTVPGFWPGAWTMANLARAGYGATSDGTWPYSYNSCDIGTLPNQTNVAGTGPAAALDDGYGGALSYQPGQRLSACTCKGDDHPGPNTATGRGSPEIDILEAQVGPRNGALQGGVSQSAQICPYDDQYDWDQTNPASQIYNTANTFFNTYQGGVYQEACSAVTMINPDAYGGQAFESYGFEYQPGPAGHITWSVAETETWTLNSAAIGPNAATQVSQRLISAEPMYIILNLGMSQSFQVVDFTHLKFPSTMYIDYVRVYQREGQENIGCSPDSMPTAKYIQDHLNAYTDNNLTTWEGAGYTFPRNSLKAGC
ncbi:glycoside hydrolase family 16 protein [Mixia osmundae IAM 14324]|uniref:GH16 domain-containing protein n=1 Tax=Mixia osmundae (strain CBS 9802 / IAM 14324 / JCM 22182 / KY 12970) TaxID=764103 RepID=G7DZ32_MIXOS|nr:glycoside hydrolase family 16 protein [Mixia osmundae IAM 14324]KEI38243.1 glycoside hydrolase family 16 protein [Mixia osmundae IAM 14324]GAA95842.1 hypothetical protein E5Q_02499 [Mixia osmundae IAM 14324]